jgi:predicted nucleotidyltransferase
MNRQQVMDILRKHRGELDRLGVRRLSLFGSTVRGEAVDLSDVDILVEFDQPVGLFTFFRLQHRLEEILGVEKVDLVQAGGLHPELRDGILAEAQHVA